MSLIKECSNCKYGETKFLCGNGITAPPYFSVIKCKFDNEYYKKINDTCDKWKGKIKYGY